MPKVLLFAKVNDKFSITFDCQLEEPKGTFRITGQVERFNSYIFITELVSDRLEQLPVQELKKLKGTWVHTSTLQESNLSRALGYAIDRHYGTAVIRKAIR